MFAENFFAAITVWRDTATPRPRSSAWMVDAAGVEHRFTLFRAEGLRPARRLPQHTLPLTPAKRASLQTIRKIEQRLRRAG